MRRDLEQIILVDVRGQSGKRLPPRAAQPHQQRVRARLRQHAADARHVLYREPAGVLLMSSQPSSTFAGQISCRQQHCVWVYTMFMTTLTDDKRREY